MVKKTKKTKQKRSSKINKITINNITLFLGVFILGIFVLGFLGSVVISSIYYNDNGDVLLGTPLNPNAGSDTSSSTSGTPLNPNVATGSDSGGGIGQWFSNFFKNPIKQTVGTIVGTLGGIRTGKELWMTILAWWGNALAAAIIYGIIKFLWALRFTKSWFYSKQWGFAKRISSGDTYEEGVNFQLGFFDIVYEFFLWPLILTSLITVLLVLLLSRIPLLAHLLSILEGIFDPYVARTFFILIMMWIVSGFLKNIRRKLVKMGIIDDPVEKKKQEEKLLERLEKRMRAGTRVIDAAGDAALRNLRN